MLSFSFHPQLEEELGRLRVLRSQNLEKFMVKVRAETEDWWEKCFVDPAVRKHLEDLYGGLSSLPPDFNKFATMCL